MQNRPLNPCSLAVLTSHHDGRYCVLLHNSHCTHSAESPCILHARIKNVRRSAWRAPCCCVTWAFCNACPAGSSLWESSVSQENTNLASWSKQATVIDQTQNHLNQALESRHYAQTQKQRGCGCRSKQEMSGCELWLGRSPEDPARNVTRTTENNNNNTNFEPKHCRGPRQPRRCFPARFCCVCLCLRNSRLQKRANAPQTWPTWHLGPAQ